MIRVSKIDFEVCSFSCFQVLEFTNSLVADPTYKIRTGASLAFLLRNLFFTSKKLNFEATKHSRKSWQFASPGNFVKQILIRLAE